MGGGMSHKSRPCCAGQARKAKEESYLSDEEVYSDVAMGYMCFRYCLNDSSKLAIVRVGHHWSQDN